MKFRVERSELTDAVAWTARSLSAKAMFPILSGLLLEADSNGVRMSTYDLENSASVVAAADVVDGGKAVVHGRLLTEIARTLPNSAVEIVLDGSKVVVTCGSTRMTLPVFNVEDFPALPGMPASIGTVESSTFASAVTQVAVAAGKDADTLQQLTGIRIEIDGGQLTLAATDRYRLAVRTLDWTAGDDSTHEPVTVPARVLADVAKALGSTGQVRLGLGRVAQGEGIVGIEADSRTTTARLIELEFPRFRQLLPESEDAVAEVESALLLEALKRARLVLPQATSPVTLRFDDGELTIDAGSGDSAQATERLPINFTGEPLQIAFNPSYLADGLNAIDSSTARISMTTASKPAVITAPGDPGTVAEYRYLLMPMRVQN